jgi:hypothetical protein
MVNLRSAILSVMFAIAIVIGPLSATAQDENPVDLPAILKPERSTSKPIILSAVVLALLLAFIAASTTALALAYKSNRISPATACFIAGAVLVTLPALGIVSATVVHAWQSVALGHRDDMGAPNAAGLADEASALLPVTVFMYASFVAVPFGFLAIVAAFFFKKTS